MSGRHHDNETSLELFDEASQAAAAQVIARYSSSFGMGAKLLPRAMRVHIASVYAMVRVADEVVDTYRGEDAGEVLAGFEAQVHRAMSGRFSPDVIAHAFGVTARAVGIDRSMVDPFFASMRMDLTDTEHDAESFAQYVHGSAEVVGEMCLAVFMNTGRAPQPVPEHVRSGARRLGAAYQKVNFLRDLGSDYEERGRTYFPDVDVPTMTDADVARLTADCRADIAAAKVTLPELPQRPRAAVATTVAIFEDLLARIEATPAQELVATRVRVPLPVKARHAALSWWNERARAKAADASTGNAAAGTAEAGAEPRS
ncbi:squalene/phytoene synthase family protein [Demequina sp. B12]|uniref:phytoene/squalene synthase family protein n=1 Tax=Demequina sp. B12 TaxID=2992757 RepID=UPI00237B9098|nr:squalene/phytoene synthase family protein [Demequina sp. B12]MDE0572097.1 squalene/phytoene synthase family protein [Demequina sp. B12]